MDWQLPQFLYLILPLCAAWAALAFYSERRRQAARVAFVSESLGARILPVPGRFRFWIRLLLQELAFAAGLIALARPQFGMQFEKVIPRGSDLYVLMDVSRSMLADDVSPSRLQRAQADVSALLNRLEGERIGLIAFAGQAVVKCPLTVDYDSFRRALNELDPDSAPRGGTAIGDAIRKSLEVFRIQAERDQAVLLITDGDDQESYPLEAAAAAAEKKVTIFAVGLGDASQGARIPQKTSAQTYVEHEGQQVWSRLNGKLLQEIALKTSGVYIPVGTRAYDLGELYEKHLQGRRGENGESQQRVRKGEQFQLFLAIALSAFLLHLCISPCIPEKSATERTTFRPGQSESTENDRTQTARRRSVFGSRVISTASLTLMSVWSSTCWTELSAGESQQRVKAGLKLYGEHKYEQAEKQFAAAAETLEKEHSADSAIASFNEACALHRRGETEKARDRYLKAGMSADRSVATAAHFNLGTMSAEKARTLAGEHPDKTPEEKRTEILNSLKEAVVSWRHCLELQPEHAQARRNLELVRQWIKYYTDRWRELDRRKLRDESDLITFLEFLIRMQTELRENTEQLPSNSSADMIAELRLAQDELSEEIPVLKDKITDALKGTENPAGGMSSAGSNPVASREREEGIQMLQAWADQAADHMENSAGEMDRSDIQKSIVAQLAAVETLNQIWDAIVPFQPLLQKEVTDQSVISRQLAPLSPSAPDDTVEGTQAGNSAVAVSPSPSSPASEGGPQPVQDLTDVTVEKTDTDTDEDKDGANPAPTAAAMQPQVKIADRDEEFRILQKSQNETLRRARLLHPKAAAELSRLESQTQPLPPGEAVSPDSSGPDDTDQQVQAEGTAEGAPDPEQLKAGYRKAIELAPQAVEQMESTVRALDEKNPHVAAEHADEARRLLEEIQQAQPKQQPPEQNQKDQNNSGQQEKDKQDQSKSDQDQKKDDSGKDQKEGEPERKQEEQKEPHSSDEEKSANQKRDQQQASQDRIEDALRKVRERQQQKRERDRSLRVRVKGQVPVDKDW